MTENLLITAFKLLNVDSCDLVKSAEKQSCFRVKQVFISVDLQLVLKYVSLMLN